MPKRDTSWLKNVSNESLGAFLKEYISESEHSSWEGFSSRDLIGIYWMLEDMRLYVENLDDVRFITKIGSHK